MQQGRPDVIDRLSVKHDGLDLFDRLRGGPDLFPQEASTLQPTRRRIFTPC